MFATSNYLRATKSVGLVQDTIHVVDQNKCSCANRAARHRHAAVNCGADDDTVLLALSISVLLSVLLARELPVAVGNQNTSA